MARRQVRSSALQLWQDVSGDEKLVRIRGRGLGVGVVGADEGPSGTLTKTTATEGTGARLP